MTTLVCERCHHASKRQGDLLRHLARKTPCEALHSERAPEEIARALRLRTDRPDEFPHACPGCEKRFRTHQGVYQHKRRCAAIVRDGRREDGDVNEEQEQGHDSEAVLPTNEAAGGGGVDAGTGTGIVTVRHKFGREEVSALHANRSFLTQCVRRRDKGIIDYLQMRFMAPTSPANSTARVTNIKLNYVQIFDGADWVLEDKNDVLDDMLDNACDVLQMHYDEIGSQLEQHIGRYAWMARDIHDFYQRELGNAKKRMRAFRGMRKHLFMALTNYCRKHPGNVGLRVVT